MNKNIPTPLFYSVIISIKLRSTGSRGRERRGTPLWFYDSDDKRRQNWEQILNVLKVTNRSSLLKDLALHFLFLEKTWNPTCVRFALLVVSPPPPPPPLPSTGMSLQVGKEAVYGNLYRSTAAHSADDEQPDYCIIELTWGVLKQRIRVISRDLRICSSYRDRLAHTSLGRSVPRQRKPSSLSMAIPGSLLLAQRSVQS